MPMKKLPRVFAVCLIALLLLPMGGALSMALPAFIGAVTVPPDGPPARLSVDMPSAGTASLVLMDENADAYDILAGCAVTKGVSEIPWDGTALDGRRVPEGEYTLSVYLDDGSPEAPSPAPDATARDADAPLLSLVRQSTNRVTSRGIDIDFDAREPGTLTVRLLSGGGEVVADLSEMQIGAGVMTYRWEGRLGGERAPLGSYTIEITLTAAGESAAIAAPFYLLPVSLPYSGEDDGTFWSMTPGEIDDAVIWEIMMQPIYVWNNYEQHSSGHAYLMENPDGTGRKVAQIHARSQGLHILGDINEYGYVLVETFSNYDLVFKPRAAELDQAFDVKQGYLEALHIKNVEVSDHIGLLVDKLTQRMYLFVDGVRVTEFLISTGSPAGGKLYRETIAGEFTTIGYVGGFWSNGFLSDMAVRYNGGSLIHEVPCTVDESTGKRNYTYCERLLGQKASAGCVRVQRLKNADGYNMKTLWETLFTDGDFTPRYKVLVWDDRNREDRPAVWYPTPIYN